VGAEGGIRVPRQHCAGQRGRCAVGNAMTRLCASVVVSCGLSPDPVSVPLPVWLGAADTMAV